MIAAIFCLSSSRSTARSTLYSRPTGVPSCRRLHVERPFVQHHICTVTRGLQTASQDFPLLPGHPDMTYLLLIIIVLFSGISCGPCNNWRYLGHVTTRRRWRWWYSVLLHFCSTFCNTSLTMLPYKSSAILHLTIQDNTHSRTRAHNFNGVAVWLHVVHSL